MPQELQRSLQTWRSEAGSRLWLSALIAAMEEVSRPDRRPVEASMLEGLQAQLRLPASFRLYQGPVSGLRH